MSGPGRAAAPGFRTATTVLVSLQLAASVLLLFFGVLVAGMASRPSNRQTNTFADLAVALGLVLSGAGLVLTVVLGLTLRAWLRRSPVARGVMLGVEGLLLVVTGFMTVSDLRLWPIAATAAAAMICAHVATRSARPHPAPAD